MQIQVCLNEEGALRNQRYAFTDKLTLISELMQNARRAGARCIEIAYDEASGILRAVDDGCGITDFQINGFAVAIWFNRSKLPRVHALGRVVEIIPASAVHPSAAAGRP